jgi:DNA-binding NtrC family response regulator
MARAAQRSACHFLLKPADPAAVIAVVEQHCARAKQQRIRRDA